MSPQLDPTAERLVPGLPLLFSQPELRTPGRVALSDGVTDLGGQHRQGKDYRPTAYVPAAPWRLPTAAEFALLCPFPGPAAAADTSSFVGLVKLPDAALAALAPLRLDEIETEAEYLQLIEEERFTTALASCALELWPYCATVEGLKALGVRVGPPGLPTVAADPDRWAGLHVDDWDEAAARSSTRNRLCINLGREPRYFVFINRTVSQLDGETGAAGQLAGQRGTRLGNSFMAAASRYPVTRLRVDPGEAYIAPTDDLIHDGSSEGKRYPDITYTLLGHFRVAQT